MVSRSRHTPARVSCWARSCATPTAKPMSGTRSCRPGSSSTLLSTFRPAMRAAPRSRARRGPHDRGRFQPVDRRRQQQPSDWFTCRRWHSDCVTQKYCRRRRQHEHRLLRHHQHDQPGLQPNVRDICQDWIGHAHHRQRYNHPGGILHHARRDGADEWKHDIHLPRRRNGYDRRRCQCRRPQRVGRHDQLRDRAAGRRFRRPGNPQPDRRYSQGRRHLRGSLPLRSAAHRQSGWDRNLQHQRRRARPCRQQQRARPQHRNQTRERRHAQHQRHRRC